MDEHLRRLEAFRLAEGLTYDDLARLVRIARGNTLIPTSIFSSELGPLEAIVKYLKEQGMRFADIARLLGRDPRVIGVTYRRALGKQPRGMDTGPTEHFVDASCLADKRLTVLEHIVSQLADLKTVEIARLLHRDPSTIWTIKRRIREKNLGGG